MVVKNLRKFMKFMKIQIYEKLQSLEDERASQNIDSTYFYFSFELLTRLHKIKNKEQLPKLTSSRHISNSIRGELLTRS